MSDNDQTTAQTEIETLQVETEVEANGADSNAPIIDAKLTAKQIANEAKAAINAMLIEAYRENDERKSATVKLMLIHDAMGEECPANLLGDPVASLTEIQDASRKRSAKVADEREEKVWGQAISEVEVSIRNILAKHGLTIVNRLYFDHNPETGNVVGGRALAKNKTVNKASVATRTGPIGKVVKFSSAVNAVAPDVLKDKIFGNVEGESKYREILRLLEIPESDWVVVSKEKGTKSDYATVRKIVHGWGSGVTSVKNLDNVFVKVQ